MNRHEHRRVEPLGDRCAVIERQILITFTRQRHPDPAPFDELVAECLGKRECQVLLGYLARYASSSGIASAMACVDHHNRPAARTWCTVDAIVHGRRKIESQA